MCVHRTACLSRRLDPGVGIPRCHGSVAKSPTSGLSSTGESVARVRRFRRTRLDAPMGFWIDRVPMPAAPVALDSVRYPCHRTVPGRAGVPPPESSSEGKCSRLVWLRQPMSCATRRSSATVPVRWQSEDCTAAGPPASRLLAEVVERDRLLGNCRPEGRRLPRLVEPRRVLSGAGGSRGFLRSGPSHPKVLGPRRPRAHDSEEP